MMRIGVDRMEDVIDRGDDTSGGGDCRLWEDMGSFPGEGVIVIADASKESSG